MPAHPNPITHRATVFEASFAPDENGNAATIRAIAETALAEPSSRRVRVILELNFQKETDQGNKVRKIVREEITPDQSAAFVDAVRALLGTVKESTIWRGSYELETEIEKRFAV